MSDALIEPSALVVVGSDIAIDQDWTVGPCGLIVHGQPSFESAESLSFKFSVLHEGLAWAIGDFLNYAEDRFGERASQIVDAEHFEESSLKVYRWVAAKVSFENRRGLPMTFGHHQVVAGLVPKQQQYWLDQATSGIDGPWTVAKLKAAIRDGSDLAATSWIVQAICDTAEKRKSAVAKLESIGLTVKVIDRHEKKKTRKTAVTARARRRPRRTKKR